MTEAEAQSLYKSHPGLAMRFVAYHKYTFNFEGEDATLKVEGALNGVDNIYREKVTPEPFRPEWTDIWGLGNWVGNIGCWHWVKVTHKPSGETYEYEDWG